MTSLEMGLCLRSDRTEGSAHDVGSKIAGRAAQTGRPPCFPGDLETLLAETEKFTIEGRDSREEPQA